MDAKQWKEKVLHTEKKNGYDRMHEKEKALMTAYCEG